MTTDVTVSFVESKSTDADWRRQSYADGLYTNGKFWVARNGNRRSFYYSTREEVELSVKQFGFCNYSNDGIINWSEYWLAEKEDKMEYKTVKKITGEELYKHNPPKGDFDEFVKEFGFFREVGVELLCYIKKRNYQCWFDWLERRGFIEKSGFEWDISKMKIEKGDDGEVSLIYDKWHLITLNRELENGGIVCIEGGISKDDPIPSEFLTKHGFLKLGE